MCLPSKDRKQNSLTLESDRQIELSIAIIRQQMAEAEAMLEASIAEIRARIETEITNNRDLCWEERVTLTVAIKRQLEEAEAEYKDRMLNIMREMRDIGEELAENIN